MSEPTYNNQTITQYLLGSLPEAETESLDELSVTDDEFAGALSAAERDLVDAYVQGELAGAELERFKSYYLASPLRREKVKFAQAFQVFAEKHAGTQDVEVQAGGSAEFATERKRAGWLSGLGAFFAPRLAWQWGTAFAALALLIAGSWLVFDNMRLRQQMSQTEARRNVLLQREQDLQEELEVQRSTSAQAEQELARVREERERLEQELKNRKVEPGRSSPSEPSIASFILVPQMRGVGQLRVVSVPATANYVAMQLELESGDHAAYRVALLDQSNQKTLWRSGSLRTRTRGDGKALAISFRAGLLKPQAVYILRVSGVSASGAAEIVGDYPFRVVK